MASTDMSSIEQQQAVSLLRQDWNQAVLEDHF
jgi:hypothetical protein